MSAGHALNSKSVQEFIKRTDLHFDLVINEEIYHDAFLMFGKKFNAPVVTICEYILFNKIGNLFEVYYRTEFYISPTFFTGPYGIANFFDYEMGLTTPLSHISHTSRLKLYFYKLSC